MRKINTVKELVDFAYNRYKTKKAITIESDYIKNINYFNFRFDIYSMARVIKSKENQIRNNKIAIISEFRYEFLVTYLANIMVNNAVILIDNKLSKNTIEKVIKDFKKELPEVKIYVYNNNSSDKTYEIASSIEGVIVRNEYNQGKGNVVRRMFREVDADIYVMVDGDDTYPARMRRQWWRLFLMNKRIWLLEIGCPAPILRRTNDPFIIWGTGLCAHPSTVCLEATLKIS